MILKCFKHNTIFKKIPPAHLEHDITISTPTPSGRQQSKPEQSNMVPPSNPPMAQAVNMQEPIAKSAPSLIEEPTSFTIHFPPTSLQIKKGLSEGELAKVIMDENAARAKVFKKDLRVIQQEIVNMINKSSMQPSISTGENSILPSAPDFPLLSESDEFSQPLPRTQDNRGRTISKSARSNKGARSLSAPRKEDRLKKFNPETKNGDG